MTTLEKRLEIHFALCAAAMCSVSECATASIVYSGIVNISIPGNFAGVYLNMVTGQTGTSAASVPGYDFNPYYGGHKLFMLNTAGNNAVGTGSGTAVANLPPIGFFGSLVGPGSPFISSTNFPTMENFTPGVSAYVGVRFRRESDSVTLYGCLRIIKSANSNLPGTIADYAYESSGGAFVPFPSPGTVPLLALAALAKGRRRKQWGPAVRRRHIDCGGTFFC